MLLDGKLWKCGTLALTPKILSRMGNPNIESWMPYIDPGIDSGCSEKELISFVNNFGKPHRRCAQCPTIKDTNSVFDHKSTVSFKGRKANQKIKQ
jgi:hypothetical protein